jgi:hypothetical protein
MFELLDIIVISAVSLIALVLILFVVVMSMKESPLRDLLVAFSKRAALTSGCTVIDPPSLGLPFFGEVVVIGSLVLVAWYWWTFLRDDVRAFSKPSLSRRTQESSRDIEVVSDKKKR